MADPALVFRRRVFALLSLLVVAVAACVSLAFLTSRRANHTLSQMAVTELEAARLARQFRTDVDDLHGALLRIGSEPADDSAAVIRQRRAQLNNWLNGRETAARTKEEKRIMERLAGEVRSYFIKLDGVSARPGGLSAPLDRDTIVMFDDSANRLQSMADNFAAAHDADLRQLLGASLASVRWMRTLVLVCLTLLVVAIGAVVALVYRDVVRPLRSRLFESETLLAQREKLAALGTLAAGVAHEIRNPLTAVKARLYTLRRCTASPGGIEDVQAIAQEIDRLEHIVREVLEYARPAASKLDRIELSAWLNDLAEFVRPDLEANRITLVLDTPAPVSVPIDADQLRQVVLNLVRNAQEAFAGKSGRIVIALRSAQSVLRGRPAAVALLSVTDDGPGIPATVQPRLFDPFFTTKTAGTGLGLSIVARLVEQHGGEIAFQSAPQAGTRFSVCLPIDGAAG